MSRLDTFHNKNALHCLLTVKNAERCGISFQLFYDIDAPSFNCQGLECKTCLFSPTSLVIDKELGDE